MSRLVAIVPCRQGSKRIPGKNSRSLGNHPLLAYSIAAAIESGVVDRVFCSTDSPEIANLASAYGAEVPSLRPEELSGDNAHDIGYVRHAIDHWFDEDDEFLVLLRPPNPFRRGGSITRALQLLTETPWADSVRALRPVSEHPGKMWRVNKMGEATTYLEQGGAFNGPTQQLERLFVQSSALEVVRKSSVLRSNSISGKRVLAIELHGFESLDLNTELDWMVAEHLSQLQPELLPKPHRIL